MMKIHQLLGKIITRKNFWQHLMILEKMDEKRVLCFSLFESVLKKDDAFDQNQTQNLKSNPLRRYPLKHTGY